jgi:TolB-like protein
MSLLSELKRRNVYRVGAVYAVVAWVVVQVASVFVPALNLTSSVVSFLAFVALLGLPVVLVLAWLYELTPQGLKRTEGAPQDDALAPVKAQRLNYVIIGSLAVAVAVLIVDRIWFRDAVAPVAAERTAPAIAPPAAATTSPAQPENSALLPNSVAVLPFANLSPDPDKAYFAQGIHDELLNQLSRLDALSVIARSSVLRYANSQTPLPDIARELRVETILEASVRYAGNEVRITAQLVDPATGAPLWSDVYQRTLDDVFAIQADIAMNIANALRAEFSLEEQRTLEQPLTSSPEAYDLYLQALAIVANSRDAGLALLGRAITLDPRFAEAHSLRAQVHASTLSNNVLSDAVPASQREEALRRVREDATTALALKPMEPRALAVLASLDIQTWHWSRIPVIENLDLRYSPPSMVWVHAWAGNVSRALAISERWARLDPNVPFAHANLGVLYAYAGDRAASNRSLQRALDLAPTNTLARAFLAYNAAASGDAERALAELERLERLLGANPPVAFLPELAYAYGRIGRPDDAARLAARVDAAGQERDLGTGARTLAHLAVGDEELALAELERAVVKTRNHEPDVSGVSLMNLKMNFLNDPRLTTPRFADVLARIRGD